MRAAVLEALAWRVVSDLVGRHAGRHPMALAQVFTDDGPDAWLHLVIRPFVGETADPVAASGAPVGVARWAARLGASGGRCHVIRAGLDAWHGDFVDPLLSGDDAAFADRLDRALGLRMPTLAVPTPLQPCQGSPQPLAVRLIADALARESASRRPLAAVGGAPDIAGRICVAGWAAGWPIDDHDPAGPPMPEDLIALQDAAIGVPALVADGERRAVIDLRTGRLWLTGGASPAETLDLAACFERDGRRLSRLVERVRSHLGRGERMPSEAVSIPGTSRVPVSGRPPTATRLGRPVSGGATRFGEPLH
jgi:hypothetical protein